MGMYIDHAFRVMPPRAGQTYGSGAARAIACNAATTSVELDNDIFQFTAAANNVGQPGNFGRALMQCTADGGDIWVNFGGASTVVANSAATSGNTVCDYIPAGKAMVYEIDPKVDLWISARTANGGSNTATLRYRIISPPSKASP